MGNTRPILPTMKNVYQIFESDIPLPLVFDSPHSGSVYPDDFRFSCARADLEKAEDRFVDELFSGAPAHGSALLCALFPRSYIDTNRAVDDIDPNLLAGGAWPYGDIHPGPRSEAGIGLIRRLVKPGLPVYGRTIGAPDIAQRIERYYKPYHAALETLLNTAHYNFGQVWHINCHSMPSTSARPRQPTRIEGNHVHASDFVLGDRDGTTCDRAFTHAARDFLRGLGYHITINDPFKGAELIGRYASPARHRHSLQIEVNKSLFMNEERNEKSANFESVKADIERFIVFCADFAQTRLVSLAAD
ncbi:MAG: N-formylglutamate amidohydrolase [Alphaproteobacteria bacterium]